jgi:hypothetical protein
LKREEGKKKNGDEKKGEGRRGRRRMKRVWMEQKNQLNSFAWSGLLAVFGIRGLIKEI